MRKIITLISAMLLVAGICSAASTPGPAYKAGIQKEALNRGLVAINNDGKVSVSWRYLESDPVDVSFDLYRQVGKKKAVKINSEPLTKSTHYTDEWTDFSKGVTYTVKLAGSSAVESGASYTITKARSEKPYLEIPIKPVEGFEEGYYTPNDATVADLDGDGEYEIVMKLETRTFDNSRGGWSDESTMIDAYKLDGTFMWRVDLGVNIRSGAHYTQMSLYDFDGDGKAELAVKTAEGTVFGDGTKIGDVNGDGKTDYRNANRNDRTYGMILEGPEFLSVIDGQTGKELARTDFIARGDAYEFGDIEGNRVDRYLGGAGYFDGQRPSILICRGYYAKTVLEAWDWRDGKLTKRWRFDTWADNDKYVTYEGQGAHSLRIGDVDGDGKDEVVYGACLIDDNGKGVYTTKRGHGDALHMFDIIPDRPGLEVWMSHEDSPNGTGSEMRDAATGELIWGYPAIQDVGRGMAADIDPRFRGAEAWSSGTNGTYTAEGRYITSTKPSVNMAIWWDGDLSRELLDGYSKPRESGDRQNGPQGGMPQGQVGPQMGQPGQMPQGGPQQGGQPGQMPQGQMPPQGGMPQGQMPQGGQPGQGGPQMGQPGQMPQGQMPMMMGGPMGGGRYMKISKWNGNGVDYFDLPGEEETGLNNGSKSNPCISADLFGDWREELVVRAADNKSIRIYMSDIPTEYRFHTLMSDIVYRMSVLTQNICYNQPSEIGYPLGSDLGKMWPVQLVAGENSGMHSKNAAGMNDRFQGVTEEKIETVTVYRNESDKYVLDAYLDYDSVEWTVNGKLAGTGRYCTLKAADYGYDKPISVSVKAVMKGQVFEDGGTVVFSSKDNERKGFWSDRDKIRKGTFGF